MISEMDGGNPLVATFFSVVIFDYLKKFLFMLNTRNRNIFTFMIPSLVRKTLILSCPYWSSSRPAPTSSNY